LTLEIPNSRQLTVIRIVYPLSLALAVGVLTGEMHAAPPQVTTAYYTEVHGAGALIQCMNTMGQIDPKYYAIRDKAIRWSLRHVHPFPDGGKTWIRNPSAPKDNSSYRNAITTVSAYNCQVLLQAYRATNDPKHLDVVKDNVVWFKASAIKRVKPQVGDLYLWTSRHLLDGDPPNARVRPLQSGHRWGIGSTFDLLATYYMETGDESVVPYLIGGARAMLVAGKKSGAPGKEQCHWVRYDGSVVMGYCRGNAGTAFGLLRIAEALPGAEIGKGRTIEDLVNASLRFILAEARQNDRGIIWENINGQIGEINLGYGRGISGIGYVMWLGQQMNQRVGNEEMADACQEAARATVDAFLATVDDLSSDQAMTEFVGTTALVETIGACSGITGSFLWLETFADMVRDEEPALAARCDEAMRKVAYRLINTAYVVKGTYAWKNHDEKFGLNTVNMAIDHGQTGAVESLAKIGLRLEDQKILDAARKAADFVVSQTVVDGDGVKMPHIVPLDPNAQCVVDLADSAK
jgi:hypothetical protein